MRELFGSVAIGTGSAAGMCGSEDIGITAARVIAGYRILGSARAAVGACTRATGPAVERLRLREIRAAAARSTGGGSSFLKNFVSGVSDPNVPNSVSTHPYSSATSGLEAERVPAVGALLRPW